jgi:type IV pilus assembly protein PilA
MAVLVGVLAPAYLKYVEKSRKSTDVDAVSTIIDAAATVSADVDSVVKGNTFVISKTANADANLTATNGQQDWVDAANLSGGAKYSFKSKTFKADGGEFTGTVQDTGAVVWENTGSGDLYKDMTTFSTSFAGKFES